MIKVILSISSSYTHFAQFVQDLVKNASKFTSQSQLFTGKSIPALELTQCEVILLLDKQLLRRTRSKSDYPTACR